MVKSKKALSYIKVHIDRLRYTQAQLDRLKKGLQNSKLSASQIKGLAKEVVTKTQKNLEYHITKILQIIGKVENGITKRGEKETDSTLKHHITKKGKESLKE